MQTIPGFTFSNGMTVEDINELGRIVGAAREPRYSFWKAVRFDPRQPAAAVTALGTGCGGTGAGPALGLDPPAVAGAMGLSLQGGTANTGGFVVIGQQAATPIPLPAGCTLYVDPALPYLLLPIVATDANGAWQGSLDVPSHPAVLGATFAVQAGLTPTAHAPGYDLSNGVLATVGF